MLDVFALDILVSTFTKTFFPFIEMGQKAQKVEIGLQQ